MMKCTGLLPQLQNQMQPRLEQVAQFELPFDGVIVLDRFRLFLNLCSYRVELRFWHMRQHAVN